MDIRPICKNCIREFTDLCSYGGWWPGGCEKFIADMDVKEEKMTINEAISELEKYAKHKTTQRADFVTWHDLRKNPDDFPEDRQIVQIAWINHHPFYKDAIFYDGAMIRLWGSWFWWSTDVENMEYETDNFAKANSVDDCIEVVAWRPLAPFEE